MNKTTDTGSRDADEARTMTAHAIDRSIAEGRTYHLGYLAREAEECAAVQEELLARCDDSADSGSVTEYWGSGDPGQDWRVHVEAEVQS